MILWNIAKISHYGTAKITLCQCIHSAAGQQLPLHWKIHRWSRYRPPDSLSANHLGVWAKETKPQAIREKGKTRKYKKILGKLEKIKNDDKQYPRIL